MLDHRIFLVRAQLQQVFGHCLTEGNASCASLEEILCKRSVEEVRFVRDDIVKDGYHLAMLLHPSGDVAQRWGEPRHPVSDDEDIRSPLLDSLVGLDVRKRISRVQQRYALYRHGFIVLCHVLSLAREEDFWVLSGEIECLDNVSFAQFFIEICVELRNATSVRVETGQ